MTGPEAVGVAVSECCSRLRRSGGLCQSERVVLAASRRLNRCDSKCLGAWACARDSHVNHYERKTQRRELLTDTLSFHYGRGKESRNSPFLALSSPSFEGCESQSTETNPLRWSDDRGWHGEIHRLPSVCILRYQIQMTMSGPSEARSSLRGPSTGRSSLVRACPDPRSEARHPDLRSFGFSVSNSLPPVFPITDARCFGFPMPDKDSRLDTLDEASNALTSDGENGNHRLHTRLRSPAPIAPEAVRGAVSRGAIANAGEQCPTCTASIRGRFCSQCGEKAPSSRPWSVWAFVRKSFTSILEADNRFFRSLVLLMWRPGLLTNAYLSGKRKPLMKPVQLFAIVNILFVILASNIGPDTFRTPLRYHVTSTNFYHQELAARWVNTAINAPDNWSYEAGSQSQLARDRSIPDSAKGLSRMLQTSTWRPRRRWIASSPIRVTLQRERNAALGILDLRFYSLYCAVALGTSVAFS